VPRRWLASSLAVSSAMLCGFALSPSAFAVGLASGSAHGKIAPFSTMTKSHTTSPGSSSSPTESGDNKPLILIPGDRRQGSLHASPSDSSQRLTGFNSETITPPGGSSGEIEVGFSTLYTPSCGFLSCSIYINGGTSYADWLGSTPFNARSITLTDKISTGGFAVSVSVPSGVGFSVSGSTVSLTSTVSNNWEINHSYSGIRFKSYILLTGPSQSDLASFTFGAHTYYLGTH